MAAVEKNHENYLFTDVQSRGAYPGYARRLFEEKDVSLEMEPGDEELLRENTVDYIGFSYYSSRLAGTGEANREHILSTAAMINAMKPRHLSALTFMAKPGTPMGEAAARGAFTMLTPAELLEETKLLLEHLDVDPLHFTSNHASNYLPLKGGLPEDREKFLSLIDQALEGKIRLRKTLNRGI